MPKLIKQGRGNYTNTDNHLVRDDSLRWGARGLFNYMWSQADGWQFYVKELVKHSPGGETELRNLLNELEEHGYLKRTPRHDDKGKFGGMNWILSDVGGLNRRAENPDDGETSQNPEKVTRTPSCGETVERQNRRTVNRTLSNINIKNYKNKEISNKRKEKSSAQAEHAISEIIDYLSKKANTEYSPDVKAYQDIIKNRMAEGYTVDDFKTVINNQAFAWQNTPAWQYMRPSTLFSDKHFDEYLHANDLNKFSHKHVEKGTDWAKKIEEAKKKNPQVEEDQVYTNEQLKKLFSDLDNG